MAREVQVGDLIKDLATGADAKVVEIVSPARWGKGAVRAQYTTGLFMGSMGLWIAGEYKVYS